MVNKSINKMKRVLLALSLLTAFTVSAQSGTIVVEGTYYGKNLYVQNPFASSGVGFCTIEVQVNGQTTTDEINSSAFEVDLSFFQLELGSPVEVKIRHRDDCKPQVLNKEDLSPRPTFEVQAMKVDKDGKLFFVTSNETGALPYTLQQFRWNKWVDVTTIDGLGNPEKNEYIFQIPSIHSGENRFRLKQDDPAGKPRLSFETKYRSPLPPVTFADPGDGKKAGDKISFSASTMYEIYDEFGRIVDKGISKTVDVSKLGKGTYYVNFDNTFASFRK